MTNVLNNILSVEVLSLFLWHLCLELSLPLMYSRKKIGMCNLFPLELETMESGPLI